MHKGIILAIAFITAVTVGFGTALLLPKSSVIEVQLTAIGAVPDALAVPVGATVQFNTKDGQTHNMALGAGNEHEEIDLGGKEHEHEESGIESGYFGPDEAYKIQFGKAGIYHFHDHEHPNLFATVIVYAPESK